MCCCDRASGQIRVQSHLDQADGLPALKVGVSRRDAGRWRCWDSVLFTLGHIAC